MQARVDNHLFQMTGATGTGDKLNRMLGSVNNVAEKMAAAEEITKPSRPGRRRAGSSASAASGRSPIHGQHSGDFSDIASPAGSTDKR